MPLSESEDAFDPILGVQVGRSGRTCTLTGFVQVDGLTVRLYPTTDPGVWLEIDAGDVRECIDAGDPALPKTLIVSEEAPMSLRMDVTASTAQALIVSSQGPARVWAEWRTSPRNRAQNTTPRRVAMRKPARLS